MTITARMLTQDKDGIGGYMAHPDGAGQRPGVLMAHHAHGVTADYKIDAYRLAQLGFNVLAPSLFNMFGIPGTNHIGQGADLQAKHSDPEFLGKLDEAWQYLTGPMKSDPARTACIGHCMGGRLLIPFAADHPVVKAIVLYYPSVRDEPETSHRPRHAFSLARTLKCATLVFAGGKEAFLANGQPVEWHYFSDANHGFRHPDNDGFQPHYADLAWPLVTDFLQRRV